jgi:hypothetical protein
MHGGFLLFHAAHVGEAGSFPQTLIHFRKIRRSSHSIYFHASIVQIAGVAGQLQLNRNSLNEIAEAHALHSPADEVSPGHWHHWFIINGNRCLRDVV